MSEAVGQTFRHHGSELPPGGDIRFRHARFPSGNDIVDDDLLAVLANDIALMNLAIFCRHLKSDKAFLDFAMG